MELDKGEKMDKHQILVIAEGKRIVELLHQGKIAEAVNLAANRGK